jgi:hypothetical protein
MIRRFNRGILQFKASPHKKTFPMIGRRLPVRHSLLTSETLAKEGACTLKFFQWLEKVLLGRANCPSEPLIWKDGSPGRFANPQECSHYISFVSWSIERLQ